jgi:hypothetical protein
MSAEIVIVHKATKFGGVASSVALQIGHGLAAAGMRAAPEPLRMRLANPIEVIAAGACRRR